MRVLFWSETFWPRIGGVENLAARLLPALRARGHEFAVVTWENIAHPDQISYEGIPVYRVPFFLRSNHDSLGPVLEYRRQILELKKRFAPALVHVNSYGRSVLFHLSTANAYAAPVLLTLHQVPTEETVARDSLFSHLLRTADWVNTCSDAVLASVRQLVPETVARSSAIQNAMEAPNHMPQPLRFDPPRLLCVGRLVPEKGFDEAVTAFATVVDQFPTARLTIAGDGPERQNLTKQIIELGLSGSIEFTGNLAPDKVLHLIDQATLVLVPSRSEGFGLVALEAGMMGRPVVATRVGGLPEVVLHRKTGLLVEQQEPEGLADAIRFLLSQPQAATAFGKAARQRVQEVFSFEHYVDAYDDLYQRLAGEFHSADRVRL